MIREMVKIDEDLCNGCGECVPNCHEGALQIIDGKARLISDLLCDGLGACIGHCPKGAIAIEKREAEPYNESKVMEIMVNKGPNTVIAHMLHLKEHGETSYLKEAKNYLQLHKDKIDFDISEVIQKVHHHTKQNPTELEVMAVEHGSGCPGARARSFEPKGMATTSAMVTGQSELRQWPVQMHLINPAAGYFHDSDLVVAADCVAFSMGNFHQKYLKGKTLAIACPKLDNAQDVYVQKVTQLIDEANVNTLTVVMMQVPCCGGLLQIVKAAAEAAERKVPIKAAIVSLEGDVLEEEWI